MACFLLGEATGDFFMPELVEDVVIEAHALEAMFNGPAVGFLVDVGVGVVNGTQRRVVVTEHLAQNTARAATHRQFGQVDDRYPVGVVLVQPGSATTDG